MELHGWNLEFTAGELWKDIRADGLELEVIGDKNCPDPAFLDLADKFLPLIDQLGKEGLEYLDHFAKHHDWIIEAVVFGTGLGLHSYERLRQAEILYVCEEDFYGLWSVGFSYEPTLNKFFPCQFSRKQT